MSSGEACSGTRYDEGTLRGHVRKGDRWEDLEVYGVLRYDAVLQGGC